MTEHPLILLLTKSGAMTENDPEFARHNTPENGAKSEQISFSVRASGARASGARASGSIRLGWAALLLGLLLNSGPASAWGPRGHELTNSLAVSALPTGPLRTLFLPHREYIARHSNDPDTVFRGISKEEGPRHFMDIDRYGSKAPFLDLPRNRSEAEKKYGAATVIANGTVPWVVGELFQKLVDDMRQNDSSHVLVDAAILGHYVADSHVPLHAVQNYDGQMTDQKGVHRRWETVLVDEFVKPEAIHVTPVRYLDDPVRADFSVLVESALLVQAVLSADQAAHTDHPDYDSEAYRQAYWTAMGPMILDRLGSGAGDLASVWHSAWVVAGQPTLSGPATEIEDTAAALGIPHDRTPSEHH